MTRPENHGARQLILTGPKEHIKSSLDPPSRTTRQAETHRMRLMKKDLPLIHLVIGRRTANRRLLPVRHRCVGWGALTDPRRGLPGSNHEVHLQHTVPVLSVTRRPRDVSSLWIPMPRTNRELAMPTLARPGQGTLIARGMNVRELPKKWHLSGTMSW